MAAQISKVGVLGCGLMGHGITQVAAQSGYDVVVREVDQGKLDKGIGRIDKQLGRAVEKGRMEQAEADGVKGRITATLDYGDLADCDLVVEAITEDLGLKLEMWKEVDGIVKPEAFFATNTSSLPVFNPVQEMKLLEVVKGITTNDDALAVGTQFGEKLGKLCVPTRDTAGFIVN